jgi:hypothetical protein
MINDSVDPHFLLSRDPVLEFHFAISPFFPNSTYHLNLNFLFIYFSPKGKIDNLIPFLFSPF